MSVADAIRESIRTAMADRPGATNKELAQALGFNEKTVGKYVRAMRSEWKADAKQDEAAE